MSKDEQEKTWNGKTAKEIIDDAGIDGLAAIIWLSINPSDQEKDKENENTTK